jgi:enediyne biosynthesis protein E4
LVSCDKKPKRAYLFEAIDKSHSGIEFVNELRETDEFNIIEYLYFYNGGGVSIGDVNNDGYADIYFSSNQGGNKLYLNKGNFKFVDITQSAGVVGIGNWKTGVTMADVNGDGFLDIYLCGVGNYKSRNGFNQLFINNGNLTFSERAFEYGLNFSGFSTQAAFFDFDLDGDLDMYLLNHSVHSSSSFGDASLRYRSDSLSGDRLYANQLVETGRVTFVDITKSAGILSSRIGYGLGLGIADLNRDGYPDIYVSNDFYENDYLYINRKDGTFELQDSSLSHTSRFSMGNDLADINNDLWTDIFTTDMLPREESVIKTSAGEDSYEIYQFKLKSGFGKQVSRNALQINRGRVDSGKLLFTDVAFAANVGATDWSWSPLLADFDGDGWKDIFITNGIVKRPNDLDYLNFISTDSMQRVMNTSLMPAIKNMPGGKVSNFVFQNGRDLNFIDRTVEWGFNVASFSNGSAYGDLDNDGDLDLVVNNIDTTAFVYKNNSTSNYVAVCLRGDSTLFNSSALGSKVIVYSANNIQGQELFLTRGWCSSSDSKLVFGLGSGICDSIKVIWPDGKSRIIKDVESGNVIISYQSTDPSFDYKKSTSQESILEQVQSLPFRHRENEYNAFNSEGLIPHMLTTTGPRLAVADINSDGVDDVFIGGARGQAGSLFMTNGSRYTTVSQIEFDRDSLSEDIDAAFFDVDRDGDLDLVVVAGGQEIFSKDRAINPRLYVNIGHGNFKKKTDWLTNYFVNASCLKPADYDRDGDIDFFVGSNLIPLLYGMAPTSFLFENDGKGNFSFDPRWLGQSTFDNVTKIRPGMVKDATWLDLNKDLLPDLVLVGEWMPITVLIQQADHTFSNQTKEYGLSGSEGWWNRIAAEDFDLDGDLDLIVGNLGLNSRISASKKKPLRMYLGDFDSNGGSDHILVYYNGENSYPFPSRDQLVKQLPGLKKKFLHYYDYRDVDLEDIITPAQKGNSALLVANTLTSVMAKNTGKGFVISPLPLEAQLFPIQAIAFDDANKDGFLDLLLAGNLMATQPDFGPYDAGLGLLLLGDGKGNWKVQTPSESGFVVKGEARDIQKINTLKREKNYIISRNNDFPIQFKFIK